MQQGGPGGSSPPKLAIILSLFDLVPSLFCFNLGKGRGGGLVFTNPVADVMNLPLPQRRFYLGGVVDDFFFSLGPKVLFFCTKRLR